MYHVWHHDVIVLRKPAHVVGHEGVGLHHIHDAVPPGVLPAPQVYWRRGQRVVRVHADGVSATASL